MEGFKDKRSLQIAIEENKGVISTVWDAIINFFKGIYDWIAGFFGKKDSTANANIEKAANVDKAATLINKIDASKPEEAREIIKEVKQLVKLKDVLLFLITAVGGFFLASFHLRQHTAPKVVVLVHAAIGLGAFTTLLDACGLIRL